MRAAARISTIAAVVSVVSAAVPAVARADLDGIALNGKYAVVSDGQYATTNQVFHDEAVVTSTWTIESTCTTYQDCTGRITSDRGWVTGVKMTALTWRATRAIPDWEPCPDGTTAPGTQSFMFAPHRADDYHPTTLSGSDETVGPSGACGKNLSLVVRMPLRLTKIE